MANNLLVFAKEEAQKSLITMPWFCLTFSDSNRNHLADR